MTVFRSLVVVSGCGICSAGFTGIATRGVFLPVFVRPLMLGIMAGVNQRDSLCVEMVIILTVQKTIVIPQLQFSDKVIDDPVVRVQVLPGRSR